MFQITNLSFPAPWSRLQVLKHRFCCSHRIICPCLQFPGCTKYHQQYSSSFSVLSFHLCSLQRRQRLFLHLARAENLPLGQSSKSLGDLGAGISSPGCFQDLFQKHGFDEKESLVQSVSWDTTGAALIPFITSPCAN